MRKFYEFNAKNVRQTFQAIRYSGDPDRRYISERIHTVLLCRGLSQFVPVDRNYRDRGKRVPFGKSEGGRLSN